VNRWVVICGAIRNRIEFNAVLAKALDFRKSGLVSEIVLSTWIDEIDEGLRSKLKDFGVHTVETPDTPIPGPQNIWRQFRSYDVGIRACPHDAEILRARTDKCYVYFDWWKESLNHIDLNLPQNSELTVFPGRIYVPYLSLSALFFCKDIFFYGRKAALNQLTHYEYWSNSIGQETDWAELRWFSYPFITKFPILRDVLETVSFKNLSTAICTNNNIPPVVTKLLGLYYRLLSENLTPMNPKSSPSPFFIEDAIFGTGSISHVATIPDGKFTSHMAPWIFERFKELGKARTILGEQIIESFYDEKLPFTWTRLSEDERLEIAGFAGAKPGIPRYTFQDKERKEIAEKEVLDLVSTNIIETEHDIIKEILSRDRFSPILEGELASYWYKNQNPERGNYWLEKAFTNRVALDYTECVEALIRFARTWWLAENQPESIKLPESVTSRYGFEIVELIVAPGKRSRVDNLIMLGRNIKQEFLPDIVFHYLLNHLILVAEESTPNDNGYCQQAKPVIV